MYPFSPKFSQGRVFDGRVRGESMSCLTACVHPSGLVCGEVTGWLEESVSSNIRFQLVWGVHRFSQYAVNSSTWWAFQYLQKNSRVWLRMLSMALEEELKVLDFVWRFDYCYFVLLNCFYLFQHFLTSLITFALWAKPQRLKLFYKQKAGSVGRSSQSPTLFPLVFLFLCPPLFLIDLRGREGSELGVSHS